MVCDKISYESYKSAQDAIGKISTKQKQSFKCYKCPECSSFHIASIKKKQLNQLKVWKEPKWMDEGAKKLDASIKNNQSGIGAKFTQKKYKFSTPPRTTYTIGDAIKYNNSLKK